MPRCVLGEQCQYPQLALLDGHRCQRCQHRVHVFCGQEDPDAGLSENLTCFLCINSSQSDTALPHSYIPNNIFPIHATTMPSPLLRTEQDSPILTTPILPSTENKRNRPSKQKVTRTKAKSTSPPQNSKQKVTKDFRLDADKTRPDPLLMKPVAFDVDDHMQGTQLYEHFGGDSNASKYLSTIHGKHVLLGTIVRVSDKKKLKNLGPGASSTIHYDVQWEQSDLGDTPIHMSFIFEALSLYQSLSPSANGSFLPSHTVRNRNPLSYDLRKHLMSVENTEIGTPAPSEDDEDMDNTDDDNDNLIYLPNLLFENVARQKTFPTDEESDELESVTDGSDFCWSTGRLPPPSDRSTRSTSHVKPSKTESFSTPMKSLLAFIPFNMFNSIAFYSNIYAHHMIETSENGHVSGRRWESDITINEIMKFFGILFKMVLRPTPGQSYPFCWNNVQWHPYTTHMRLRRFQQIRSVLHFNDNSTIDFSKDAAFKVRLKSSCLLHCPTELPDSHNFLIYHRCVLFSTA